MAVRRKASGLEGALRERAIPLEGVEEDWDALLDLVGDARLVLLGEASHGTHEFYRARAEITKRLIEEKGFSGVAAEADWPDAWRVGRFVKGQGEDASPEAALEGFKRFPTWMWRNADVVDFVAWLRAHNASSPGRNAGFYGIDLYSMFASMRAVLDYLDRIDPEAASRARRRYACFEHFGEDSQSYGYAASFGLAPSCEDEVVKQLVDLQSQAPALMAGGRGGLDQDARFFAEQNARLVKNAERYYRSMFRGQSASWNLRDTHMVETIEALLEHLGRDGERSKLVVWAHNSHLGDARATEMGWRGQLNVGQLVRERFGQEAVLVGFTTHEGTVTAAADWDEPGERKRVLPSLEGSYERLFHETGLERFFLSLRDLEGPLEALRDGRLERAIGVVYLPETERFSHYFEADLPNQFDAVIHFDATRAVTPLEPGAVWHEGEEEPPETYPEAV